MTTALFLFGISFQTFSQDTKVDVTSVTKLTILNPGISYETKVGKFQTMYAHGFMSVSGYFSYSDALGADSKFYFDPATDLQYRFYYNGMKRFEMEKRTEMNSMNYIAIMSEFVFTKMRISDSYIDESSRRAISKFGVGWGFQRNYAQRFSLDLNLGVGYLMSKGTQYMSNGQSVKRNISLPTTMGQLNLGFWLNRKKKSKYFNRSKFCNSFFCFSNSYIYLFSMVMMANSFAFSNKPYEQENVLVAFSFNTCN